MDWPTVLTSFVTSLIGPGVLVLVVRTWVTERLRNSIRLEYEQRLETHKAQLKAQAEVEAEKLRSQLNMTAKEHEFKFGRLHERRLTTIAETFALLRALYSALSDYVTKHQAFEDAKDAERAEALKTAFNAFRGFYQPNTIFLPRSTVALLETIDRQILNAANQFTLMVKSPEAPDPWRNWIEVNNRVDGEIKSALSQLETEFRRHLEI